MIIFIIRHQRRGSIKGGKKHLAAPRGMEVSGHSVVVDGGWGGWGGGEEVKARGYGVGIPSAEYHTVNITQ